LSYPWVLRIKKI